MRKLPIILFAGLWFATAGNAYDSPISNPPGVAVTRTLTYYQVSPSSTPAAQLTALNAAIADCISGAVSAIRIPTGLWQFSAEPNPILTTGSTACAIHGDGVGATLLRFPVSAASSVHTFWKLGNDTTRAVNVTISDMSLQYSNSPTADSGCALNVESATDFRFQNIRILGSTCPLQLDAAAESGGVPSRGVFQNVTGDINNGLNETCNVLIYGGSAISFNWWNFTGGGDSNNTAGGALECLTPASGHQIDTLRHSGFGMQSFTSVVAADGKPYGAKIDSTNGNIYNVSYDSLSYFDHTTTSGILYTASVGGTGFIRNHVWSGSRHTPDTGSAVIMDVNSGQIVRSVRFLGSRFFVRDTVIPIIVKAAHDAGSTDYEDDSFEGVDVEDIGSHLTKEAAFQIEADGWSVPSFSIGSATRASSGFTEVLKITNTAISQLLFGCGALTPDITTFSSEPTYTTVFAPARQICHWPLHVQVMGGGSSGLQASNSTIYYPIGSIINSATLGESGTDTPAAVAFTVQSLACKVDAAPGVGNTATLTLRKNSASPGSGLVCTVSGAATTGTVTGSAVSYAVGDTYDMQVVLSASATTSRPHFSVQAAFQ